MKSILIAMVIISIVKAQPSEPSSFFPSSVGNVWEYSSPLNNYKSIIIKDSIDFFGNRFLYYPSSLAPSRARFKIDPFFNIFRIHTSIDSIYFHYYKLDADSGEFWTVQTNIPRRIARVNNIYNALIFGKQRTIKEIGYYRLQPGDTTITNDAVYERYILLASGIGEFYEYNFESGPERVLLGCVIQGDTLGIITSIKSYSIEGVSDFILKQNYPNPFNSSSVIQFELKTSSMVTLKVYSLIGTEVRTLADGYMHSGKHELEFNAAGLASGMYIYRLSAGNTTVSKKMIYAK